MWIRQTCSYQMTNYCLIVSLRDKFQLTLSSTCNCQIPRGFSPQVCTDMNGQCRNPAGDLSSRRTERSWAVVPKFLYTKHHSQASACDCHVKLNQRVTSKSFKIEEARLSVSQKQCTIPKRRTMLKNDTPFNFLIFGDCLLPEDFENRF